MSNISKSSLNLLMEEVYLKGKLNSLNKDIINENLKMNVNPTLKEVMSQLKTNFNFIMTYGVGISGFIGPVKSLLQNKGLQVTDYDVTLLVIVAIYILLSKPKEEIDEVVEKLKENGLEKEISPVLDFMSKTVNFFKVFGSRFGYTINGLLDILSFTFLSAPVLDFIKNVVLEKNFNINNVQELLTGVLLAISSHGLKSLINKKITKENNLKESPLLTEGKYDFLENESLVGLKFYNPEEFTESGTYYTIWDQDSSVNSIDIEWELDDLSEDGDFMTDYSTMPISGFIENLNKGFFVLKDFGESLGLPDPYDIISGLNESVDNSDWWGEIPQLSPAEEFLYDLMTNLTIVESEKSKKWMFYKDKNGKILMTDNINTGTKKPELWVHYDEIWQKLENYGLETQEIKALCVRMLEMVHKRKVLTASKHKLLKYLAMEVTHKRKVF